METNTIENNIKEINTENTNIEATKIINTEEIKKMSDKSENVSEKALISIGEKNLQTDNKKKYLIPILKTAVGIIFYTSTFIISVAVGYLFIFSVFN